MFIRYFDVQDCYRNSSSYNIIINVAAKRLTLFKKGKLFKTYPIAVGKPSTPTPKGNFRIINKDHNPGWPFDARWLGLNAPNGIFGIHGTNNPVSISKAITNGCISTYNKNIIELYNLVSIGTLVKIV